MEADEEETEGREELKRALGTVPCRDAAAGANDRMLPGLMILNFPCLEEALSAPPMKKV
jgi:hypothetical protein